jgi:hypothetical protein
VRAALPEEGRALLDQAFAGDALAARRLMVIAPRRMRGHIAFLSYEAKVRNPAYREIIRAVWTKDARALLIEFWRPQVVRRMLARAEFRVPHLKGPVAVFRAVHGSARKGMAALSWSLSADAALSSGACAGEPATRVMQAMIEPSDIIYWRNGHGDQEIVSRRPLTGTALSGPRKQGKSDLAGPKATRYRARSHHH